MDKALFTRLTKRTKSSTEQRDMPLETTPQYYRMSIKPLHSLRGARKQDTHGKLFAWSETQTGN